MLADLEIVLSAHVEALQEHAGAIDRHEEGARRHETFIGNVSILSVQGWRRSRRVWPRLTENGSKRTNTYAAQTDE